ncbi:MAG: hypothetical protein ACU84J_01845 [Gammaproteobacteria bacterium]
MRLQKTISLDADRSVTVRELRVNDARNIMAQAEGLKTFGVKELVTQRIDELSALLKDCIELPNGETLGDLTFSEVKEVKNALLEVNESFLDLLGIRELVIQLQTSTNPAVGLSNEDTSTSPTTDGDSSEPLSNGPDANSAKADGDTTEPGISAPIAETR